MEGTMMKVHESVTLERVLEAAQRHNISLDDPGFCIECGHEQEGCEPDARDISCENCGESKVYGAEELVQVLQEGV
jgi:hypothetical protein